MTIVVLSLLALIPSVAATEVIFDHYDGGGTEGQGDWIAGYSTSGKYVWGRADAGMWAYSRATAWLFTYYTPSMTWSPIWVVIKVEGFKYYLWNKGRTPISWAKLWVYVKIFDTSTGIEVAFANDVYHDWAGAGESKTIFLQDKTWTQRLYYNTDPNGNPYMLEAGKQYKIVIYLQHGTSDGISLSNFQWSPGKVGLVMPWFKLTT